MYVPKRLSMLYFYDTMHTMIFPETAHPKPSLVLQSLYLLQERIVGGLDRFEDITTLSLAGKAVHVAVAEGLWAGVHKLRWVFQSIWEVVV